MLCSRTPPGWKELCWSMSIVLYEFAAWEDSHHPVLRTFHWWFVFTFFQSWFVSTIPTMSVLRLVIDWYIQLFFLLLLLLGNPFILMRLIHKEFYFEWGMVSPKYSSSWIPGDDGGKLQWWREEWFCGAVVESFLSFVSPFEFIVTVPQS